MITGKLIGGLIGFFAFGGNVFGAIFGVFVGHFFDKGRAALEGRFNPEQQVKTQQAFFSAIFPVLGHLAKVDGRVSEEEVAGTEQLMTRMGLDDAARKKAIELFKQGIATEFDLQKNIADFMVVCGNYGDLKQIYLVYLITLAYADNHLHEKEEELLKAIAAQLGYSSFAFNHLLGMVRAQTQFHQQHGRRSQGSSGGYQSSHSSVDELDLAYKVLGVDKIATDAELKKAYRKLMSEYHPDKLAGRGVPEDMIKVATERAQEIQAAYDMIKKSRKA